MKIRLHGTPEETADGVTRLAEVFDLVDVSAPYADRSPSQLVRVYVEVRLDQRPAGPQPAAGGAQ